MSRSVVRAEAVDHLGRWLFRQRGWIGAIAYALVLLTSRASARWIAPSVPLAVIGLVVRIWALGYVGQDVRGQRITADRRVVSGPYRWFAHPLYIGNGFLVLAAISGLRPPSWLAITLTAGFAIEYSLIAFAEGRALAGAKRVETSFSPLRAMAEWQTLAAMALAYGLGLVKAAF